MELFKTTLLFVFISTIFLNAETITVGSTDLIIPAPASFAKVTPKMSAVYRLLEQSVDPVNGQLVYYIEEQYTTRALAGEIPNLKKTLRLKVSNSLNNRYIDQAAFKEFIVSIDKDNSQLYDSIIKDTPGIIDETVSKINNEFNSNFDMSPTKMLPLPAHKKNDYIYSYSMLVTIKLADNNSERTTRVFVMTNAVLNVSGKIIHLYAYAPQEELEWTRSSIDEWCQTILENNPQSSNSFNKSPVIQGALKSILLGVLLYLTFIAVKKLKKRKGEDVIQSKEDIILSNKFEFNNKTESPMNHKSRIVYSAAVYGMMAAACLLPGMGAIREIFTGEEIGGVHIFSVCMYLFFIIWLIRSLIMRVEINERAVMVRTFWKTCHFPSDDSITVEEVLRPMMRRGITLETSYRKYLRVENDEYKIDVPYVNIDKYDELKSAFGSMKKSPVETREIPPSTTFKVLDFFV